VRGDPTTGLKGRRSGEVREVPMIPEMYDLVERLRPDRPDDHADSLVMRVRECQKSNGPGGQSRGMERITHHDLRSPVCHALH